MADTFRERERSEEAKFKLDEELKFKARCRRNKLVGQWAAALMGKTPEETDAYARDLVGLALERPGADALARRVGGDLQEAGMSVPEAEIAGTIDRCYAEALDSISSSFPKALDSDHAPVGG